MRELFVLFFIVLISIIFFNGCSEGDDPVQPQEEHFEAIGVVFFDSGNVIASILRGNTGDTLKVKTGEVTNNIQVKFYDENENIIDPPETVEQEFSWELKDENVAELLRNSVDQNKFSFNIRGLSPGITKVEFFILHEGHADFRSGDVPLKVF